MVAVTELPVSLRGSNLCEDGIIPHREDDPFELAEAYEVPQLFVPEIALLIHAGVLGKEAKEQGWDNVGEHCILSGNAALGITYLDNLDPEESYRVCSYMYRHDALLRRKKEAYKQGLTTHCGSIARIEVSNQFYFDQELSADEQLAIATSMDWRGYREGKWSRSQKIVRYVDSIVGPCPLPDNQYGRDCLQPPTLRAKILHERKRSISEQIGELLYGGVPAFLDLAEVSSDIEEELFYKARSNHAELFSSDPERYRDASTFFQLTKDVLDLQIALKNHPLFQLE